MMTGKYAKVPCISAMHNCLASALRGIRQGPAWHYARHLCMAKYRSRFGVTYEKIGTIQRRLAWPLHKDDTLSRSGRPTGLNIYFFLHSALPSLACWASITNAKKFVRVRSRPTSCAPRLMHSPHRLIVLTRSTLLTPRPP